MQVIDPIPDLENFKWETSEWRRKDGQPEAIDALAKGQNYVLMFINVERTVHQNSGKFSYLYIQKHLFNYRETQSNNDVPLFAWLIKVITNKLRINFLFALIEYWYVKLKAFI